MPHNTLELTVNPTTGNVKVGEVRRGYNFSMQIEDLPNMEEIRLLDLRDKEDDAKGLKLVANKTTEYLPNLKCSNSGPQLLEYVKNQRPGCQPTFDVYLHSSPFPPIPVCHIIGFKVDDANMEREQRVATNFDSTLEQSCKMLVVAMILKLAITIYDIDVVIKRPVVVDPEFRLSDGWITLGGSFRI